MALCFVYIIQSILTVPAEGIVGRDQYPSVFTWHNQKTFLTIKMRNIIFIILVSFAALCLYCGKPEQVQVDEKGGRCVQGNCRYGVGTYIFPNGNRYEGEFRSNVPFG